MTTAGVFAVVNVTSGQMIWAGDAADRNSAARLATEALGKRRPSASWYVCLASALPDGGLEEACAVKRGIADGTAAVNAVLNEQGRDAVIDANRPGQEGWDWAAINADAASWAGIAPGYKKAYYRAYAAAGRVRAEAIEDGRP